MSRVVEFSKAGGPEVLRFKNVDVPEAGPGQVRVRVKAIGLNRAYVLTEMNRFDEADQSFEFTKEHCERHGMTLWAAMALPGISQKHL